MRALSRAWWEMDWHCIPCGGGPISEHLAELQGGRPGVWSAAACRHHWCQAWRRNIPGRPEMKEQPRLCLNSASAAWSGQAVLIIQPSSLLLPVKHCVTVKCWPSLHSCKLGSACTTEPLAQGNSTKLSDPSHLLAVLAAVGQMRVLMMAERSFEIRLVLLEAVRETQDPWVRLELLGNGALVKACPVPHHLCLLRSV